MARKQWEGQMIQANEDELKKACLEGWEPVGCFTVHEKGYSQYSQYDLIDIYYHWIIMKREII